MIFAFLALIVIACIWTIAIQALSYVHLHTNLCSSVSDSFYIHCPFIIHSFNDILLIRRYSTWWTPLQEVVPLQRRKTFCHRKCLVSSVVLPCTRTVFVKCLPFSTDRPDYLKLFRTCVSRNAASKGRAVLEGVGLSAETIEACINSHPLNEEEAVQAGLTKWSGGQGLQPPMWEVLIEAMEYAQIAEKHETALKEKLGL